MAIWDLFKKKVIIPTPSVSNLHKVFFDVMIIDDIDEKYVVDALMTIPNIAGFKIVPVNWDEIEIDTSRTPWKGFVYPKKWRDNLIVIFDGRKRGFVYGGGACIQDEKFHRIGISNAAVETSSSELGLRIWHEILHCILYSGEADQLYSNLEFREVLPSEMRKKVEDDNANSPYYLLLFNMFLTMVALRRGVK